MYWPRFEADLLAQAVQSLKKRSKALKHKTQALSCERVIEDEGSARIEKLELELRDHARACLRLFLWQDGWVWLDARRPSKSGWVWEWTFEGRWHDRDRPGRLVEALEATIAETSDMTAEGTSVLTEIWRPWLARGPEGL